MIIGKLIIHRASRLRKLLKENLHVLDTGSQDMKAAFWALEGIYQTRIFGIVCYRRADESPKFVRQLLDELEIDKSNDQ